MAGYEPNPNLLALLPTALCWSLRLLASFLLKKAEGERPGVEEGTV
jgi:hypothetical protein